MGKLHNISQEDRSVELRNITSFGTEDREKENTVPKSETIIDFQIFEGKEIKELKVLKE